MKKCMFFLFVLALGIAEVKADMAADIQGLWTLSTLEGGDTTLVSTPEEMLSNGNRYIFDFPLTTTKLEISGTNFVFTYYENGSRAWSGTIYLEEPSLTLNGTADNCSECDPKVLYLIIRSVTATEMVVDIFDEDAGTSTYAHYTFTK